MDEIIPPQPEPTITLPITTFLDILWAYKKHQELRDRAVPGKEVVLALQRIPNWEKYYHIQFPSDGQEGEPVVWQREFWRDSGERTTARDAALAKLWSNIDATLDHIQPMFPMLTREALRQLASDLITREQWVTLESMGIDISKLK